MADPPEISIVLLGDTEVGKSTFLSRLTRPNVESVKDLPRLRDLDQPYIYEVRLYNRPYRFEFSDTASPLNYTLLKPDVVVLCYDISRPETLTSVQEKWSKEVHMCYSPDRPTLLLGLKRDLRTVNLPDPLTAYRISQELRCDRYLECSAHTGELVKEVFEDISKTAAMTTTSVGGQTEGGCSLM